MSKSTGSNANLITKLYLKIDNEIKPKTLKNQIFGECTTNVYELTKERNI